MRASLTVIHTFCPQGAHGGFMLRRIALFLICLFLICCSLAGFAQSKRPFTFEDMMQHAHAASVDCRRR
jgi:hypothetical protein